MVSLVVIYGCESWTIEKAEHWRIGAFELWGWRRLLRVPWTARRSNQSILKQISPGCSLEGLMLKLKFQYFGHLMWRPDYLEKTLMLGKIEGRRRRGWQMAGWHLKFGRWWGRPGVLQSIGLQRVRHDWATEQQQERSSRTFFSWALGFWWQRLTDLLDYAAVLGAWVRALSWHHSETLASSFDFEQDSS